MPGFDASKSFALLFGVATYARGDLFEPIPQVKNNLEALATILSDKNIFGFERQNIEALPDPTNGKIAEQLEKIRTRIPDLDTLFVYYCGHGVVQSGQFFLTGSDAGETIPQKLAFAAFEDIFVRVNAQRKILVLDSCFSGRAIGLSADQSIIDANVESRFRKS
jgi:hypothetical protein